MSRNNSDKWTFYVHPSKEAINSSEVRYWKHMLHKILKIGLEYEFNLPNKNGTCKGDNNACPCKFMAESDCWKGCIRHDACKAELGDDFVCHGIFCTGFLSSCIVCDKFEVDCVSCNNRFDPERNPDHIRERMNNFLTPSHSYGALTKHGVHSIVTDGSLLGKKGAEVITVGRRPDYWEFFKMSKEIIDLAVKNGAFVNERTSIHAHLLASYYGKVPGSEGQGVPNQIDEMEKDMPEVILANFHQLCRRYQNAITWMTIGLDEPNRITRWEKYRVSVLGISAVSNSMSKVKNDVSSNAGGNKYGWVNYNNCTFNKKGEVKRFHVELRVMDGLLSPSAVAAMSCLYYAMMIKAIEISRYGVVEVGGQSWIEEAESIKSNLMNNTKGYDAGDRFSETAGLTKHYDILIAESFDLISQVKHILMKIGPAYEVLEKLAERPCGIRRCDGESWESIEKDLSVVMTKEDTFVAKLTEIIDLRLIDQCKNEDEWTKEAISLLNKDNDEVADDRVNEFINVKKNDGEMVWLERLGSMSLI
jgi:hypothetical protein